MLNEPLWYWLLFGAAMLFFIVPYLFLRWEERQDERDAEIWNSLHHGDTFSRRVD